MTHASKDSHWQWQLESQARSHIYDNWEDVPHVRKIGESKENKERQAIEIQPRAGRDAPALQAAN
jgi:hypothetical protein